MERKPTKKLLVLGSTGSIGARTLEIAAAHPDEFEIEGLAAGGNTALLARQLERFRPRHAAVAGPEAGEAFRAAYRGDARIHTGEGALLALCRESRADMAVVAVVGAAGLPAVLACIERGMDIALANKEALVAGGALVMEAARGRGVSVLPVDSEHSAIFQCLQGPHSRQELVRVVLTASGGPFRGWSRERLETATAADALRHPNWRMGPKITVDSATLMNKGLEVIEAHHLFGLPPERIDVTIHPQSVVHSLAEFADGAVLAQMGVPDMTVPIQYALTWPRRIPSAVRRLDLTACGPLTFEPPDRDAFPCLDLAYRALSEGPAACTVLNAANEAAVDLFLRGRIGFTRISACVEWALGRVGTMKADSPEAVRTLDLAAREWTLNYCGVR